MSPSPAQILVVDDDNRHLQAVLKVLTREGYEVRAAVNATEGLRILNEHPIELIVTDLMMPRINGMEFLRQAKSIRPDVDGIVMTAFASVERAVEAMKEGASDFIQKPIKRALLVKSVKNVLERRALVDENARLRRALSVQHKRSEIVGQSKQIGDLIGLIHQVAPTDATILVEGASGTGKELVAKAIHTNSLRASQPFVALNCAALPESILESELFGHERGAFTGAHQRKIGRFEAADHGTLFLDEIAELQLEVQSKLLRVLQEGEFERVGGRQTLSVDVRIVAATNRKLEEEVASGRFREDLYYRLNVIRLELPTLAERASDIPLLATHFLHQFAQAHKRPIEGFTPEAMEALVAYEWPGNVRELQNAVERAVVLSFGESVTREGLPPKVSASAKSSRTHGDAALHAHIRSGDTLGHAANAGSGASQENRIDLPVGTSMEHIKREAILQTLEHVGGDKKAAAELLGITTRTIYRLFEEMREAKTE